jgi:Type II secretion system protein B
MSIILDALKKSESDQQRQSGPALFEVRVAPPKARFPVWAIAIVALLAINMLIVGYMLLRRSSHTDDTAAANPSGVTSPGNGAQFNGQPASRTDLNGAPGYGQANSSGTNGMQPNGAYGPNGPMAQNAGQNWPSGPNGNPNWQAGQGGGTNTSTGQPAGGNGSAGQGGGPNWQAGQGGGTNLSAAQAGGSNGSDGQGGGRNWPGAQGGNPNWQGAQGGAPNNSGAVGGGPNGEPTLANRAREAANQEGAPSGNPDDYAPATDADSSLFKGHVKRGTESGVPLYQDMAVVPGANLPQLRLDLHVYAAKPQDRFALINMHKMHEGDSLPDNVRVESITPEGVIMSHNGSRFLLPRD